MAACRRCHDPSRHEARGLFHLQAIGLDKGPTDSTEEAGLFQQCDLLRASAPDVSASTEYELPEAHLTLHESRARACADAARDCEALATTE